MSKKFINILKTSFIAVFLFLLASPVQAAGEITIKNFSLSPTVVTNNTGSTQFQMKFGVTVDLVKFSSECNDNNVSSFYWYVYEYRQQFNDNTKRASGEQSFSRTSATVDVNIDRSITIDTSIAGQNNYEATYQGWISCPFSFFNFTTLAKSERVLVKFGSGSDRTHACVDTDNKYACSKANLTDCSDVPARSGCPTASKPCQEIGKNLCGQDAGGGGKKYLCNSNNQCVENAKGTHTTSNCDNKCSGGGGGGGTTTEFKIDNPIEADNLVQLLDVIATWLFNIAIPIMVAMIVYAGIIFLISRGDTAKVSQAKKVLLYAVVGFTIIMIGKGFITLIESILNLGKPA